MSAGECDFFCSGSDAETIKGMREGRYHIRLDPKPFLLRGAKAQGADLFIVGGWLNSPAHAFIAAKERGIRAFADLKGKKISGREPDGIDTRFARALSRRAGLDADQMVRWLPAGPRSALFTVNRVVYPPPIPFRILRHSSGFRLQNHRITMSAFAKTAAGIVRPICCATFRLITNPNFVGSSTRYQS